MGIYVEWVLLVLASLATIGDVVLIILSRKESVEVTGIKQFFLEELFSVGFFLRRILKKEDTHLVDRSRRLQELYEIGRAHV